MLQAVIILLYRRIPRIIRAILHIIVKVIPLLNTQVMGWHIRGSPCPHPSFLLLLPMTIPMPKSIVYDVELVNLILNLIAITASQSHPILDYQPPLHLPPSRNRGKHATKFFVLQTGPETECAHGKTRAGSVVSTLLVKLPPAFSTVTGPRKKPCSKKP